MSGFNPSDLNEIKNERDINNLDLGVKGLNDPKPNNPVNTSQPSPTLPQQPTFANEDDKKKRDYLILKIKKFKKNQRLSRKLSNVDIEGMEFMDLEQVEEKYNEVKVALATSGQNIGVIHFAYSTGCQFAENMSQIPESPINLAGLTKLQMANEDVLDTLTELEIEYSDVSSYTPPEYRLIYSTLSGAVVVANKNMMRSNENNNIEESENTDLGSSNSKNEFTI